MDSILSLMQHNRMRFQVLKFTNKVMLKVKLKKTILKSKEHIYLKIKQ